MTPNNSRVDGSPELSALIDTSPSGLTGEMAAQRLREVGPNQLPESRRSPIIYILLFALAFDVAIWVQEGAHG